MHYMEVGGAERALLGLLNALDPKMVDIDLFINQHTGLLMPLIPKHVNLLPERKGYNVIERSMVTALKKGQIGVLYGRLKAKWQSAQYHKSLQESLRSYDNSGFQYVADCVNSFLPSLSDLGEYDLAISFLQPHNIVMNKVMAKKRIAWIHTDYSAVHINTDKELPIWGAFDYIASISPDCTRAFLEKFPSLKDKIIEIENILSVPLVRRQAEQFDVVSEMPLIKDGIKQLRLLSIGRFCHPKNFDNVPDIAKEVVDAGFGNLKWYIIGFGGDESLIRQKIADAGMEDHVIMLGKKENPYPYIKACDIYVQPSRYEGKSITVREAQILCKPVVITNYATAKSQVIDGVDGVIVPMDNEACAQGILSVINDKVLQERLVFYLSTHDYGNEQEVNKIYELI